MSTLAVKACVYWEGGNEVAGRWQVYCCSKQLVSLLLSRRAVLKATRRLPSCSFEARYAPRRPTTAITTKTRTAADSRRGRAHQIGHHLRDHKTGVCEPWSPWGHEGHFIDNGSLSPLPPLGYDNLGNWSTSYPEVKTILKAKQHSKWRHEHSGTTRLIPTTC